MTPNPAAPLPAKPSNDDEMLDVVKWGFYAYAILTVMGVLVTGLILVAMTAGFMAASKQHGAPPDAEVIGGVMGGVFFVVLLVMAAFAALFFFVGRNVGQRTGYTFCFIVACLACVNFPLGTALGVFSLVILSRESVKAQFPR